MSVVETPRGEARPAGNAPAASGGGWSGYVPAMFAIVQRDLAIYGSYRLQLATQLLQAIFVLTLFYFVSRLVRLGQFTPNQYFGFVVVGLVVLRLMVATLVIVPTTLRQELVAGTFERLVLSPLGAFAGIVAMTIFPLVMAIVTAVFMVAFATAFLKFPLDFATAPFALPVGILTAAAFVPIALLLSASVLAFKQRASGATMVVAVTSLIAGFYFPIGLLPGWIRWASDVQPFTPALDLMRHLLIGTPLKSSALVEVLRLVGFTAVLIAIGVIAVGLAVGRGRRTGTITEY